MGLLLILHLKQKIRNLRNGPGDFGRLIQIINFQKREKAGRGINRPQPVTHPVVLDIVPFIEAVFLFVHHPEQILASGFNLFTDNVFVQMTDGHDISGQFFAFAVVFDK